MSTGVLTIDFSEELAVVDDWLSGYISKPHSEIGRSGAVCPFVEPARRAGMLETRVRLVGSSPSLALLTELVRCALDEFEQLEPKGTNTQLRSLLVVVPDLPEQCFGLFDQAHAAVKSESVRRGLMIGQFHRDATEKAARNPQFEVSKSPIPVLAVRQMAVHDVLFLDAEQEWFEEYLARFGARYRKASDRIDPVLYDFYRAACLKHGIEP